MPAPVIAAAPSGGVGPSESTSAAIISATPVLKPRESVSTLPVKDPLAWTSYRLELGLAVDDGDPGPSPEERAAAQALLEGARRAEPTRGTEDVAVALEVARLAVASRERDRIRFHLLLEAATALSVAAEACIARLGQQPCAAEGSQE